MSQIPDSKYFKDGWFIEHGEHDQLWKGQRFSIQAEEVLFHERSDFQDVLVFKSTTYGTVLVLDGVIQATERDEFSYQEMIVHLPMFSHPNPKKVLIIGGGDGGVLREVVRHPGVEKIDMCEIDGKVIEVSKRFLGSSMAVAYDDPRLTLIIDDAAKFIAAEGHDSYDVIVVDSSDPVGPAEALFAPPFFKALAAALNPGGIICTQGECQWLHLDLISNVVQANCHLFPTVEYAFTTIPTYPSGQIGFMILSNSTAENYLRKPARKPTREFQSQLRYYNTAVHEAAFALPEFTRRKVEEARGKGGLTSRDL